MITGFPLRVKAQVVSSGQEEMHTRAGGSCQAALVVWACLKGGGWRSLLVSAYRGDPWSKMFWQSAFEDIKGCLEQFS